MNDKVQIKRVFDASIDDVFDAWVNPAKMDKWHHPDGYSSKSKVDEEKSYETQMINNSSPQVGIISGDYLEFDRPNKLLFTWKWDWQKDVKPTTIEVNFKSLGKNKTEVDFTHFGFIDEPIAKQHEMGWGMSFNNLEMFLKGGE